jgi:hypothetical protein
MRGSLLVVFLGVLLSIGSFWPSSKTFDIQLYDTYYILDWTSLLLKTGLICILLGGLAFLFIKKRPRQSERRSS